MTGVIERFETVSCALCGRSDAPEWLRGRDVEFNGRTFFTLVKCRGCGLVFQSPRPTRSAMPVYYPKAYYTHAPIPPRRLARTYAHALRLAQTYGRRGPLLDVGAGDGAFLAALAAAGWPDCEGLEPDEAARRVAVTRRGLRVAPGAFPDTRPPRSAYPTITMLETLEHLHAPLAALASARDSLEPGGRLILTTPNIAALEFRLLGARSVSLQLPRHLYFFDAATIEHALVQAGLRPVVLATSRATDGLTRSLWLMLRRRLKQPQGTTGNGTGMGVGMGVDTAGADADSAAAAVFEPESWRRHAHEGLETALAPLGWLASRWACGPTLLVVAERPGGA